MAAASLMAEASLVAEAAPVPGRAAGRQAGWQPAHQKRLRAARAAVRISPPQMWQGSRALR